MTTPTRTNSSTIERDHNETPGSRRWLDVAALWVAAVSAYALILFLLAQFQMQRMQALYFGFLNTTVQLGLDMEVPVERLLEDMAECVTRAEYVRASEAELAAMEQMEQQQLQQQG